MAADNKKGVALEDKRLKQLIKAFSGKMPTARVGVLGAKNARSDFSTNATIGAKHEFGSGGSPKRSFLRVPISELLKGRLEKAGLFDERALMDVIKTGSILVWVKKSRSWPWIFPSGPSPPVATASGSPAIWRAKK